jgi:glycosyltransferase involved in cell wall biosynthesis
MKGVLFAMNWADSTGLMLRRAHQSYSEVAKILRNRGIDCYIAYPKVNLEHDQSYLKVVELDCHKFDLKNKNKLDKFIKDKNIKEVIYIDRGFFWLHVLFFKFRDIRVTMYSRYAVDYESLRSSKFKSFVKKVIHKLSIFSFDKYIVINTEAKNNFPDVLGISDSKVTLIRNGIDTSNIENAKKESIIYVKDPKKKVVLSVFQMRPEKNIEFILKVIKALNEKRSDIQYIHVGEGQTMEAAKSYVEMNQLTNSCTFAGKQDNIFPFFEVADVVIHACFLECLSNVITESMAMGKPVVTINSQGALDQIVDKTGTILTELDVSQFVKAIETYLDDDILANTCYTEGPAHVKQNFSIASQAKGLSEHILKNKSLLT